MTWTAVEDGLPKEDGYYNVSWKSPLDPDKFIVGEGSYYANVWNLPIYSEDKDVGHLSDMPIVTHWMPLPDLPKEK
jgi:hypothetical protein